MKEGKALIDLETFSEQIVFTVTKHCTLCA